MAAGPTVHGQPLILIFAFWQFDDLAKASATKRGFGILAELIAARSFRGISWSELIASSLVAAV